MRFEHLRYHLIIEILQIILTTRKVYANGVGIQIDDDFFSIRLVFLLVNYLYDIQCNSKNLFIRINFNLVQKLDKYMLMLNT